jgi:hypothetical protein
MNDANNKMNYVMPESTLFRNFMAIVESTPHFYRCIDMLML